MLVREGFAWGALFLGPLWLALHRAWIAAAISFGCLCSACRLVPGAAAAILAVGLALILGFTGRDLRCWALERRGYLLAHVFAAGDRDDAFAAAAEPASRFGGALSARACLMHIAVVDYGSGNLASASRALALAADRAGMGPPWRSPLTPPSLERLTGSFCRGRARSPTAPRALPPCLACATRSRRRRTTARRSWASASACN